MKAAAIPANAETYRAIGIPLVVTMQVKDPAPCLSNPRNDGKFDFGKPLPLLVPKT